MAPSPSGRTMNVTAAVMDDFESLVMKHGIEADTIIINQDEGTETDTDKMTDVLVCCAPACETSRPPHR